MSKILIDEATVKLVLEAMGLIGADLVCEAAHHEKADRHGIGEPCPIQARWHHAFATLREALVEQPAQQVVDSDEKAGAYMDARLWEFIDMAAAWPKASPDPRTWNHVVVYASKPAQQEPVAWTNWRELVGARHYRTPGWEMYADKRNPDDVALYTSPPAQRKPLTDEQIDAEFDAFASKFDHESNEWLDMGVDAYFRAGFKAAHGIKENT